MFRLEKETVMPYRVASLMPHSYTHFRTSTKPQSSAEKLRAWPTGNFLRRSYLYLRVVAGSYGWLRIKANVRCVMPQSHTHLRTLRMVRKARPQLSAHSVTIRITSAENVAVRILSATYRKALSIGAQILKNIKKVLRMKTTQ